MKDADIVSVASLARDQRNRVFQLILDSQYYQQGELDQQIIDDEAQFCADWKETFERSLHDEK